MFLVGGLTARGAVHLARSMSIAAAAAAESASSGFSSLREVTILVVQLPYIVPLPSSVAHRSIIPEQIDSLRKVY